MTGSRFLGQAAFAPSGEYRLLPFQFMRLDAKVLVVNEVGEHLLLAPEQFSAFASRTLAPDSDTYDDLKARHFLLDGSDSAPLRLLRAKYRTKRRHLAGFTKLHIFVVTLRCDHTCQYCQVSRVTANRSKYDMSREHADLAINMVFQSPSPYLKIEFQGGEPLLNFDLIRHIVEECERRNVVEARELSFVLTTNGVFIDDSVLAFCREHQIGVSTSLDGPAFIHNANRPRPGGDAYERAIEGMEKARAALGHRSVSALMTTTRRSLDHPVEIVDEYLRRGFDRIFLRPLSPYGFAVRTQDRTGYELAAFLDFYRKALDRIIEINRGGTYFVETYAQLLLTRILTPQSTGYVDLQSPAGAGISVAVYNYDGDVYATDESRMLAQMGDRTFRLGRLGEDSYDQMFGGALLRTLVSASCVESLPGCSSCALQSFCGADPIESHATQGDIVGHRPTSRFCGRNMEIIKHLLRLYHGGDDFIRRTFWSWVQNAQAEELLPRIPE
jgi:His-Xaa-Ser system radical SAM maturase HxsB